MNDENLTKIKEENEMRVFELFNYDDDEDVLVRVDVGEPNKLLVDLLEKLDGLELKYPRYVHLQHIVDAKNSKKSSKKLDATDMSKKSQQRVKTVPLDDFGSDQNRLKNILTMKLGVKVLSSATVATSAPAPTDTVSQSDTMSPTNTPSVSAVSKTSVPPYTESQTSVPHDTLTPDTVSQSATPDTSAPLPPSIAHNQTPAPPTDTLTPDTVLKSAPSDNSGQCNSVGCTTTGSQYNNNKSISS